jgi:hypothetical protein
MIMIDYEIGEFDDDGACDERGELIAWLVQRIETSTGLKGFCGVDISGVRADIAMLTTIIGAHGGGHLINRADVERWARRIDEPFTNERMWGFNPWPDPVKSEWRTGCRQTVRKLLDLLEE